MDKKDSLARGLPRRSVPGPGSGAPAKFHRSTGPAASTGLSKAQGFRKSEPGTKKNIFEEFKVKVSNALDEADTSKYNHRWLSWMTSVGLKKTRKYV